MEITADQVRAFGSRFAQLFVEQPLYRNFSLKENGGHPWSRGLCYMTVRALKQVFGDLGEVWVVAEYCPDGKDWPLDHFILCVKTNPLLFVDSDGAFEQHEVIPKVFGKYASHFGEGVLGEPDPKKIKLAPRKGFKRLWTGVSEMPMDRSVVRQLAEDGRQILFSCTESGR